MIHTILALLLTVNPFIDRVYEYTPAPGQFINTLPVATSEDTPATMAQKAEDALTNSESGSVCLGGWGGYVVFGFDHPVVNVEGAYDFRIDGNAFYSDPSHPELGGSSEPGVVFVSYDANANGEPDDIWYELAGSEYVRSTRNYRVTYFRPAADHVRTPKPSEDLVDTTYILWRDINGKTGYMAQNRYHMQSYYPLWMTADKLVYTGTLLPSNVEAYQEEGYTKHIFYSYAYGYADNHPNGADGSKMKIDWAVNAAGQPVVLPAIHFVKVQTGVHEQCGWTGEVSTEVSGAEDLHPSAVPTAVEWVSDQDRKPSVRKVLRGGQMLILRDGEPYTVTGQKI